MKLYELEWDSGDFVVKNSKKTNYEGCRGGIHISNFPSFIDYSSKLELCVLENETERCNAWMAMDEDGGIYLYENEPEEDESSPKAGKSWTNNGGWYLLLELGAGGNLWEKPCRIYVFHNGNIVL